MNTNQIQEMLFDTMQQLKPLFDKAVEENATFDVLSYSDALCKAAHGILEIQQSGANQNVMAALEQAAKALGEG